MRKILIANVGHFHDTENYKKKQKKTKNLKAKQKSYSYRRSTRILY